MSETIIKIEGLRKEFNTKDGVISALDGIDIDIRRGEIFGVIGISGAGKSTLVRCINMLEKPTAGSIYFDGADICTLSERELAMKRRSMGMIFQQFNLLMQRTVLNNVCFPMEIAGAPRKECVKRAKELLGLAGLSDKLNAYPAKLSGGQKQRVAIARALATNPKVLLCDEATSALDPGTTRSILALLKEINATLGVTIVVITHEMNVIEEICHRVAIIDNAKIAECAAVSEVFSSPRSEIGKKLVYPKNPVYEVGERRLRIVFNGEESTEPVVAGMVLSCGAPVNIWFADTRDIDGRAYGQIVLGMPSDDEAYGKMTAYLKENGLTYEEVPL